MSILTTKLFETQSVLSRHRFELSKRLKDPMFERSPKISSILKNRIYDQCSKNIETMETGKRKKYDNLKKSNREKIEELNRLKNRKSKGIKSHKLQLAKKEHVNNKNKRLQHPKFELPQNMFPITKKKRSFDKETKNTDEMEKEKQPRYDDSKENEEKPKELSRIRKRKIPASQLCNLQTKRKKCDGI